MRFGIRAKLVLLLTVVALLPLTAALITITVVGTRLRTESVGHVMQSTASADALALRVSLIKDVEKLRLALQHESEVPRDLSARDTKLPPERLSALDALWRRGPADDAEAQTMGAVRNNAIAAKLSSIRQGDPRIAEILVTDRHGQLVAATGRTTDFDQADEDWWQGAHFSGRGRIFVPPIDYDRSSNVWSVDVCIPISEGGRFVGVAKTVIDLSRWLESVSRQAGRMRLTVMLVARDGKVVYLDDARHADRRPHRPTDAAVSEWRGPIAAGEETGWRVTGDGHFQAYAPIRFETEIGHVAAAFPDWSLVLSVPASEPMGVVRKLSYTVLGSGLAIIVGIFLVGVFLVERSVTRRVHRLERATRSVAAGDLSHRIEADWAGRRLMGPDEIDDLAADFNRMVHRVQESYDALREANELKQHFIQIAGHELRTPVSYILAMSRLLEDCADPQRLAKAMRSVAGKAGRLDEIIHAMFKLMLDGQLTGTMAYGDVEIAKLLEAVCLDCRPFVERRGQQVVVEPVGDIPVVRADRGKLRDVVENLVMNAIKFTPDGGVIRVEAGRELGGMVAIAIHDQGPGISEADLPHIFQPFFSTADVMKHSSGRVGYQKRGMGLGLAVVRRFVELHHGTVHASSGPDGSVFTVAIPVEPPPDDSGERR